MTDGGLALGTLLLVLLGVVVMVGVMVVGVGLVDERARRRTDDAWQDDAPDDEEPS